MGNLEKLEDELYGRGEEGIAKRMKRRVLFPGTLRKPSTFWQERSPAQDSAGKSGRPKGSRTFLKIFLSAVILLFIAGTAAFIFLYLSTRGAEAEVVIHDRGPIESGELVTVPITYKNTSQIILREAELAIILPDDTRVQEESGTEVPAPPRIIKKLNDINPGTEETVEITVRFFGREREEKKVRATLDYRPDNVSARFSVRTTKSFFISRVPLGIVWEVPETITQGQDILIKLHYSSSGVNPFDNISLRLEYPPGFAFVSADPAPQLGDSLWNIGTIDPNKEGVIEIRGTLSGEEGQVKAFRGELGIFNQLTKEWRPYIDSSKDIKIAVTPLSVQAFLGEARAGSISPGDRLEFKLRYKNNTAVALKNISVHAFLQDSILDLNSLAASSGGVFDGAARAVVWGPGGTEELREIAPNAAGELKFTVQAKAQPSLSAPGDKNLKLRLRAVIEAAETPQELAGTKLASEDSIEFKLRSKVIFAARSLYRLSPILNSGPLPPRVGQKTTYTIFFEVKNFSNDLQNVEIRAPLPANVQWLGVSFPSNAGFVFDEGAHQVRWFVGTVKAGVGVSSPSLTAAFQIEITPSEADVGKALVLVNQPEFSGTDSFTNDAIQEKSDDLSTELRNDPGTKNSDWAVVR